MPLGQVAQSYIISEKIKKVKGYNRNRKTYKKSKRSGHKYYATQTIKAVQVKTKKFVGYAVQRDHEEQKLTSGKLKPAAKLDDK